MRRKGIKQKFEENLNTLLNGYIKYVNKYENKNSDFIQDYWGNVASDILLRTLQNLRYYLEDDTNTEVSWDNLYVTLEYPIEIKHDNEEVVIKYIDLDVINLKKDDPADVSSSVKELFVNSRDLFVLTTLCSSSEPHLIPIIAESENGLFSFTIALQVFLKVHDNEENRARFYIVIGIEFDEIDPNNWSEIEKRDFWDCLLNQIEQEIPKEDTQFDIKSFLNKYKKYLEEKENKRIPELLQVPLNPFNYDMLYHMLRFNKEGEVNNRIVTLNTMSGKLKLFTKSKNEVLTLDHLTASAGITVQQTLIYLSYQVFKEKNIKIRLDLNEYFALRKITRKKENIKRLIADLDFLGHMVLDLKCNYKRRTKHIKGICLRYHVVYANKLVNEQTNGLFIEGKKIKYIEVELGKWGETLIDSGFTIISSKVLSHKYFRGKDILPIYLKLVERYRNNTVNRRKNKRKLEVISGESILKILNISDAEIRKRGIEDAVIMKVQYVLKEYFNWKSDDDRLHNSCIPDDWRDFEGFSKLGYLDFGTFKSIEEFKKVIIEYEPKDKEIVQEYKNIRIGKKNKKTHQNGKKTSLNG